MCPNLLASLLCKGDCTVLLKLLDLEAKCKRWYPGQGTHYLFSQLALELAGELARAIGDLRADHGASNGGRAPQQQQGQEAGEAGAGPSSSSGGIADTQQGKQLLQCCSSEACSSCGHAGGGAKAEVDPSGSAGPSNGQAAGLEAPGRQPPGSQAGGEGYGPVWRHLAEVVGCKVAAITQGLAEMPPSSDAAFVPSLFRLPEGVQVQAPEADVVVLLDE